MAEVKLLDFGGIRILLRIYQHCGSSRVLYHCCREVERKLDFAVFAAWQHYTQRRSDSSARL